MREASFPPFSKMLAGLIVKDKETHWFAALTASDQGDGLSFNIIKSMKNLQVTNTEITKTNTTLRRWMESREYEIPSFVNSQLISIYRSNNDGNLFQPLEISSTVDKYTNLANDVPRILWLDDKRESLMIDGMKFELLGERIGPDVEVSAE
jgi:hypothetical protein